MADQRDYERIQERQREYDRFAAQSESKGRLSGDVRRMADDLLLHFGYLRKGTNGRAYLDEIASLMRQVADRLDLLIASPPSTPDDLLYAAHVALSGDMKHAELIKRIEATIPHRFVESNQP